MRNLRLWLCRLLCPKGYAVLKGRKVTPFAARTDDGSVLAIGIATETVHTGDLVGLASEARIPERR